MLVNAVKPLFFKSVNNRMQLNEQAVQNNQNFNNAKLMSYPAVYYSGSFNKNVPFCGGKTEREKDKIIELYNQGKTYQETADIIGCTENSIRTALERWGLRHSKKRNLDAQKDKITALYQQGKTMQEIADITGCTPRGAGAALARWGVHIPQKTIDLEAEKDKITALYSSGKTHKEIAEEIGCSESGIYHALDRWNILVPLENRLDKEKDKITALYIQGKTLKEIAEEIGCADTSISDALDRWGLLIPPEYIIEENKDKVINMYIRGNTLTDIAAETGCSISGISSALQRWGVHTPRQIKKPEKQENIIENNKETVIKLYLQGKSFREISLETGFSLSGLHDALKRWGISQNRPGQQNIIEQNKDAVIEMRRAGKTHKEIAQELGISKSGVQNALKRWNI